MNQDLIGSEHRDTTIKWDGGNDTLKFFIRKQKELGGQWYYNNKKITYKYNTNGFRAQEFNNINWANSVLVLGCSNVMGIANRVEDSVPSVLQDILGIPCINLGISGSAVDHACWNSLILHENYPHPKAIVQVWSSTRRYTDFLDVGIVKADYPIFGVPMCPSNVQPWKSHYCVKHSWELRSKFYVAADRALWKDKTIYFEATFFEHSAKQLEVPWVNEFDKGRDFDHPGHGSCKAMAELIAKNLKERGIK